MKHLKRFFESTSYPTNNVLSTLKDICLELEDERYEIEHRLDEFKPNSVFNNSRKNKIIGEYQGMLINNIHVFDYVEVEEVVERIKDYMQSEGYKTHVSYIKQSGDWQELEDRLESNLYAMYLIFEKI